MPSFSLLILSSSIISSMVFLGGLFDRLAFAATTFTAAGAVACALAFSSFFGTCAVSSFFGTCDVCVAEDDDDTEDDDTEVDNDTEDDDTEDDDAEDDDAEDAAGVVAGGVGAF